MRSLLIICGSRIKRRVAAPASRAGGPGYLFNPQPVDALIGGPGSEVSTVILAACRLLGAWIAVLATRIAVRVMKEIVLSDRWFLHASKAKAWRSQGVGTITTEVGFFTQGGIGV